MDVADSPFSVDQIDGAHVVEFKHDIVDPFDVERSIQELNMLVESAEPPRFVLNLSNVESITSRLIGIIMGLDIKITRKRGQLRLCCIQPRVREVFHLVRLDEILQMHDTRDAAVESL